MTSLKQLWDGLSQTHAALWAILAVSALLLWKYLRQKPMKTHYESDERPIAREILDLHDAWGNLAIFWGRLHVVLTVMAIVFAAFVASGDTLFGDQTLLRSMVAVSSAIATGLLATLQPNKTSEDFWDAWRTLNVAKIEYLCDKKREPVYLADAVKRAENELRRRRPDKDGNQQGRGSNDLPV